MSEYEYLTYIKDGPMAVIEIAGSTKKKRDLERLSAELDRVCEDISFDSGIRVALIQGADREALNIAEDLDPPTVSRPERKAPGTWSLAEAVGGLDIPVIAAIQGDAVGQGLELILACDLRVAAGDSRFGLPHLAAGLMPWDGGTQRLPRLIGPGPAMEMILLGELIDAEEAHRLGLVNRVVPFEETLDLARKMAEAIAEKAPFALRSVKEAVLGGLDLTLAQGLRLEADLYFLLHTTEDRTEGVKAFREKRRPCFKGQEVV